MDAFKAYCFGTSSYLAVQSLPLLLTPKLIVSMLASEPRRMTDLEAYFARSLGFALLTVALLSLLLTGAFPLTNEIEKIQEVDASEGVVKDPYSYPALIITTVYHALGAFYLYTQVAGGFTFGFGVGLTASTVLFGLGLWVILFGTEGSKISKSTGADKRTSNFPFENKESAREKKKESKRKSLSSKLR